MQPQVTTFIVHVCRDALRHDIHTHVDARRCKYIVKARDRQQLQETSCRLFVKMAVASFLAVRLHACFHACMTSTHEIFLGTFEIYCLQEMPSRAVS